MIGFNPIPLCLGLAVALLSPLSAADLLNPDCTAEKAAKSTAMKATVGVGGRCSPAEAATDSAKRAAGVEDKGPLEKRSNKNDDDGIAKKTAKKALD